jgi:hypothetical protein
MKEAIGCAEFAGVLPLLVKLPPKVCRLDIGSHEREILQGGFSSFSLGVGSDPMKSQLVKGKDVS